MRINIHTSHLHISHLHTLTPAHPHSSPNSSEKLRASREAQRKATHNEGTVREEGSGGGWRERKGVVGGREEESGGGGRERRGVVEGGE